MRYNSNSKIFFCEEVLNNTDYNKRGVGQHVRNIKKTFNKELLTNNYNDINGYAVFTHPPPLRNNNKTLFEQKTFELLKKISQSTCRKIIIIYDIIPHIFKEHYKPEADYYEYFQIIKQHFDIIMCISESTKNDLHTYLDFNLDKMIVIYPELANTFLTTNIENINICEKYHITKKYIIAPLGADFRKNNENTINSFIKWNNDDYQLVLMYNCPKIYKETLLSNIPVKYHKNIIFTGYVPDNDYKYLIKNAEFTIFISLYEGFGYCVMESIFLGRPVLTSNCGSTGELGNLSQKEILLCNPWDVNDIVEKLEYLTENLNKYDCVNTVLFNKCYNINNKSLINKINNVSTSLINIPKITPALYNNIHPIYKTCLDSCYNKDKVKIFPINLSDTLYNIILNIFDLNIQLRITNGGGGSGCVTDTCFLNKFILTNNDLSKTAVPENYKNVITSITTDNTDWLPIQPGKGNGYSINDISQISQQIFERKDEIMKYNGGVNTELTNRLLEYPIQLMKFLNLNKNSKICFVTPYGNDRSGISNFSYTTINELSNYLKHIDIYTDCDLIDMEKQAKNIIFFKIDEIQNNKDKYDEIIWVIGNSTFHNKMIQYGTVIGGTFLIHDETLFELYSHNRWVPKKLKRIHPFTLREKGSNIDHSYLCFHDITRNSDKNKYIVHNYILENILKDKYCVKKIITLKYPNFNFNIMNKLNEYEITKIKTAMAISDKKLNMLLIGGVGAVKLPYYAFKILDKLNAMGIDTDLYIYYNK